jgi:hypothetical protein
MQADQIIIAPPLPGYLPQKIAPIMPITAEPPMPNKMRASSGVKRERFGTDDAPEAIANAIANVLKFKIPPAAPNTPSTAAVDNGLCLEVMG